MYVGMNLENYVKKYCIEIHLYMYNMHSTPTRFGNLSNMSSLLTLANVNDA